MDADTTAALRRIEECRKRAIWAADYAVLNKARPGKTRMEMREIRADLATDRARAELAQLAADVPLLCAIARAAVEIARPGHTLETYGVAFDGLRAALASAAGDVAGTGEGVGDDR